MQPLVSVVVPTFDRRRSITRLLDALAQQSYPAGRFEVVVVDDGSGDGTGDLLRARSSPYRLRVLDQPHRGAATARNLGVEHAAGPLIVFLDDDVVARADLLAAHVASHTAPGVVAVGPMEPPVGWPRPAWVRWDEEKLQRQYRALLAGEYPCTPRQFYTANASVERARFLATGGFDPGFARAEDIELACRLRDRGARFVFNPEAVVFHYASRSFAAWRRNAYLYGRYDVRMYREKGHELLPATAREFHGRRRLNRWAARVCVGRKSLLVAAVATLSAFVRSADALRLGRAASLALSAIFNLLYWQGVCDELGDARLMWRTVRACSPAH